MVLFLLICFLFRCIKFLVLFFNITYNFDIQGAKGTHLYIQTYDGQCIVKEINPKNDILHMPVYEVKCQRCLGFNYSDHRFYFMDEYKILNKLKRMKEQR